MKKFLKFGKSKKGSTPDTSLDLSATNILPGYEVKEKDLSKIHKAAWNGDLGKIKQLAKKDPNPLDKENRTPLHLACAKGHGAIVEELLEWKAKINLGDNDARTPLMKSVLCHQDDCVKLLLEHRADVNVIDKLGNCCLHYAASDNLYDIANYLVRCGAKCDIKNKEGKAPLHISSAERHKDICQLLLEEGANINAQDNDRRTALMQACHDGDSGLVKLLLQFKADTSFKDAKGWTADDCAVMAGHHGCSQLIADADTKSGRSPRHAPQSSDRSSNKSTPAHKAAPVKAGFGAPALDGGNDDWSDNTASKISEAGGGGEDDSWGDSDDDDDLPINVSKKDPHNDDNDNTRPQKQVPKLNLSKLLKPSDDESDTARSTNRSTKIPKLTNQDKAVKRADSDASVQPTDSNVSHGTAAKTRLPQPVKKTDSTRSNEPSMRSEQSYQSNEQSTWSDNDSLSPQPIKKSNVIQPQKEIKKKKNVAADNGESDWDSSQDENDDLVMSALMGDAQLTGTAKKVKPEEKRNNKDAEDVPMTSTLKSTGSTMTKDKQAEIMADLGMSDISEVSDPDDLSASSPRKSGRGDSDWDSMMESGNDTAQPELKFSVVQKESDFDSTIDEEPPESLDNRNSQSEPEESEPSKTPRTLPAIPKQEKKPAKLTEDEESDAWDSDVEEHENLAEAYSDALSQKPTMELGQSQETNPLPQVKSTTEKMPEPIKISSKKAKSEDWDSDVENALLPDDRNAGGDKSDGNDWDSGEEQDVIPLPEEHAEQAVKTSSTEMKPVTKDQDSDKEQKPATPLNIEMDESEDRDSLADIPEEEESTFLSKKSEKSANASKARNMDQSWDSEREESPLPVSPRRETPRSKGFSKAASDTETESEWERDRKKEQERRKQEEDQMKYWEAEQKRQAEKLKREAEEELQREQEELERQRRLEEEEKKFQQEKDERERQAKEKARQEEERLALLDKQRQERELKEKQNKARKEKEDLERQRRELEERETKEWELVEKLKREREQKEKQDRELARRKEREEQERREQERKKEELDRKKREELEKINNIPEPEDDRSKEIRLRREKAEEELQEARTRMARRTANSLDDSYTESDVGESIHDDILGRGRSHTLPNGNMNPEDDGLSYTDTENEEPTHDPSYPLHRLNTSDALNVSLNLNDSAVTNATRLQEQLREQKLALEKERNVRLNLENKKKSWETEKSDMQRKIENLSQSKSMFEQNKLDLDAKIRNLEYNMNEEIEKKKNVDVLLQKTKQQLSRKEEQYTKEIESKQRAELNLRNVQMELRSAKQLTKQPQEEDFLHEGCMLGPIKLNVAISQKNIELRDIERSYSKDSSNRKDQNIEDIHEKSTLSQTNISNVGFSIDQNVELSGLRNAEFKNQPTIEVTNNYVSGRFKGLQSVEFRDDGKTEFRGHQNFEYTRYHDRLEDEREEFHRQLQHEKNARILQEQINDEQQRLHHSLAEEQNKSTTQKAADRLEAADETKQVALGNVDKLNAELYQSRMELDRNKKRYIEENEALQTEVEELLRKLEEVNSELKLNEEALAHATIQYNVQLNAAKNENNLIINQLEKEKANKEKLETELESIRSRLTISTSELDKTNQARNELERNHQREREDLGRNMEKKDDEISRLKESAQNLAQRLGASESKISAIENEYHVSNTALERTTQISNLQRELDQKRSAVDALDRDLRSEKEKGVKSQAKLEVLQERVQNLQHENLTIKQQLENARKDGNYRERDSFDSRDQMSALLSSMKNSDDRATITLQEKNSYLKETIARLNEEVRNSQGEKQSIEQELRHAQQHLADAHRKLSSSEAALEVYNRTKSDWEREKSNVHLEAEKTLHKLQLMQEKQIENETRIRDLQQQLEKAQRDATHSVTQLTLHASRNGDMEKTKGELEDNIQKLQVEKTKLESALKNETQKVESLQKELVDSHQVRSSMEHMLQNLKSSKGNLEEKLGVETLNRTFFAQESEEHKDAWETEIKARSKLGLRFAQLERYRNDAQGLLDAEKRKSRRAAEIKRMYESKLEDLQNSKNQLETEVAALKAHLKAARKRLKDLDNGESRVNHLYSEFDKERMTLEGAMSAVRRQLDEVRSHLEAEIDKNERLQSETQQQKLELNTLRNMEKTFNKLERAKRKLEDELASYKARVNANYIERGELQRLHKDLETQSRVELNKKLEDVNNYLEDQSRAREKLDQIHLNNETAMKTDFEKSRKELQDEMSYLRKNYSDSVVQKDTVESEAKKFRDLYESEAKLRERLTEKLMKASDKTAATAMELSFERQRNMLLGAGAATQWLPASTPLSKLTNHGVNDSLSYKLSKELDRSIAKHLESTPRLDLSPIYKSKDDSYLNSATLRSSSDNYQSVLRKKYLL